MKKILGISLVALMSVTAANAEIASKAYVIQQDDLIKNDIGNVAYTNGITAGTVKGAINELAGKISTNATDASSAIATAKQEAITAAGEYTNTKIGNLGDNADVMAAISANSTADQAYAAGLNTAMDGRVDALETASAAHATAIGDANSGLTKGVADNAAAIADNAAAIAALNDTYATDTALSDGLALKQNVQIGETTDAGKALRVDSTGAISMDSVDAAVTADSSHLVTSGAVATAIATETTARTNADYAINAKIGTVEEGKTVMGEIAAAKTANTTAIEALDSTKNATPGQVVTGVVQENGVITSVTSADPLTNAAYELQQANEGAGNYALTAVVSGVAPNQTFTYKWELIERTNGQ